MGKENMRNKIIGIFVCMLLITTILPITAIAGDEQNPEIQDTPENDVFPYLDIISAWFFEKSNEPGYLFTSLKLTEITGYRFKQHLTIGWEHNGIECAAGLFIGYGKPWFAFDAGYGHGWWFQEHYINISGEYNQSTGIFTCKIPKEVINNPKQGDVLTNTYALTFQRFGFIGRLGFNRIFLPSLIYSIFKKSIRDIAPDTGYGKDYIIQY
jgi:hypothetical protein